MFPKVKIDAKKKDKQRSNRVQVVKTPNYKINKTDLNVKVKKATLEVVWFSGNSKKSKRLENEFTNYVEDFITDHEIDNAIEVLNNNPEVLKEYVLDTVDINYDDQGNRLKEIIELYFPMDNPQDYYWFVKTDINTEFQKYTNSRGAFRVVMINTKDMSTSKHYLQILFVDPYHLFIPGAFNGKTNTQNKIETYKKYKEYNTCISKYIV